MGIFGFRKPKWRHKNPAIRLEAIKSIDPQEIETLTKLSREDQAQEVRWAAINRLADITALELLEKDADSADLPVISARKDDLLYNQIVNSSETDEWQENLDKIISQELLAQLAVKGTQPAVRLAAVNKIEDQHLLTEIAKQNCGKKPATAALVKITDEELLADLVENAANKTARRLASEKIAEIEQQRNQLDEKKIVQQKLNDLADEAAMLKDSHNLDEAALKLKAIKQEWHELDPGKIHPAYDSLIKIFTDIEGRHKELLDNRKREQEKAARFTELQARLNEICSTIERLSRSTAQDAATEKEQAAEEWETLKNDPIAQMALSEAMEKRFTEACQTFDGNREKILREKGCVDEIEKKCAETGEFIASHDLKKAAASLAEAEKSLNSTKIKYFNKSSIKKLVSDTASALKEAEKNIHHYNLSRRQEICAELEKITDSDKPGHIKGQLQTLKQDWQQLDKIEGDEETKLELRYEIIITELNEKLKQLEHEQDWQLWANLNLKEKLIERVVALDNEEDLETVFNVIKDSQAEWKKIGQVPYKKSQETWDLFHSACNRNFERAKPYLEELKTRKIEAMERRKEICDLAAELTESNDWKETSTALKAFQEEWKNLPIGAKGEEQQLYQQFRKSCDRFFERRKEHYEIKDKERHGNLVDKEKLCEEAEKLAAEPQIDYPKHFKRLQAEWKKIGPVPWKEKDAIWNRFRAACDKYFNWLNEVQQQNLKQKEELCEVVEKLVSGSTKEEDQHELAEKLIEAQNQWKEIGPVPLDQSDVIWQRFRKPCDEFFKARQEQFEKEEEQRRENQYKKEALLAKAEELAAKSNDKETAEQLKELQKEWFAMEPAPRKTDKDLNDRFKALSDAFFEDRRQYFTDLKAQQLENLKKKESLCLRLENILGPSYKSEAKGQNETLSLAEELKQAMEDNFMLAGRRNKKDIMEELKRIEQEWGRIGPVPYEHNRSLNERYRKALDANYTRQRSQGEGKG